MEVTKPRGQKMTSFEFLRLLGVSTDSAARRKAEGLAQLAELKAQFGDV
jgi:hypothetical protein